MLRHILSNFRLAIHYFDCFRPINAFSKTLKCAMQVPASDLIPHIIRHMSEKPDECTVCELYFVSASAASAAIVIGLLLLYLLCLLCFRLIIVYFE